MHNEMTIRQAILAGDVSVSEELTRGLMSSGCPAQEVYDWVLSPAVKAIGEQFVRQAFYLPELLVSLRAAKAAMNAVDAAHGGDRCTRGTIVIGSLSWNGRGFCHDVIVSMLEICGWGVVDLGEDVSPTRLVKSCAQTRASVLVIAELSFGPERGVCKATSQKIEALVKEMDIRGIRQRTRILVVSSASDDFAQGPNEVDAICDNWAEIPSFVERLAKHACTPLG